MRVQELWRYPVKSLQGQQLREARITPDGLDGDRRYAIFDVDTGIGLTARRIPQLLFASASLNTDGDLCIILPDGSIADGDYALSDWLGRLCRARTFIMPLIWCFLCLSGGSPILVDQAVDDLPAPDPAGDVEWLAGLMQRRSLFARLVRAMFVVMPRVFGEDPPKVSFAVDEQVVEALAP